MVDSNIQCDKETEEPFKLMGTGKLDYIIMDIDKRKGVDKVVLRKQAGKGECQKKVDDDGIDTKGASAIWHCLAEDLALNYDIAFAACYINFDTKEGYRSKFCFIYWVGEKAPITKKMIYSSTKQRVEKKIGGFHFKIQCDGKAELDWRDIYETVTKNEKV